MTNPDSLEADVGTRPATLGDLGLESGPDTAASARPMSTQAVFRPELDDDKDEGAALPTRSRSMNRRRPPGPRRRPVWVAGW